MFTGIVEETGNVLDIKNGKDSAVIKIKAKTVLEGVKIGDSIAVDGVCLTVVSFDGSSFSADVMHETLNRSALPLLKAGSPVNLERAMAADGRFGGHIVAGHIDGRGVISAVKKDGFALVYKIKADESITRYIVEKGSVAIGGISLTVTETGSDYFSVSVIPHTAACTSLGLKTAGDFVNIETDIIGKYAEKLLSLNLRGKSGKERPCGITLEFLAKAGF